MKSWILLLLLPVWLWGAQSVLFFESRYLNVLDLERNLEGVVHFNASDITIHYTKPEEQNITRRGNKLTIRTEKKFEEIALDKSPHLSLFFDLLTLLFKNETTLLNERFIVKPGQNSILLEPKTQTGTLKHITLWPTLEQVERFEIAMQNGDRILIRKRDAIR